MKRTPSQSFFRGFFLVTYLLVSVLGLQAQTILVQDGFENAGNTYTGNSCTAVRTTSADARTGTSYLRAYPSSSSTSGRYIGIATPTLINGQYIHAIVWVKGDIVAADKVKNAIGPYGTSPDATAYQNTTTTYSRCTNTVKSSTNGTKQLRLYFICNNGSPVTNFAYDDLIEYISPNPDIDLVGPSAPVAPSADATTISWTNGEDTGSGATGVQATLIFRCTSGSGGDLTLNDQGIYSLTATEGPKLDQSGHWTLVSTDASAELTAGATTSYSGTFESGDVYAIVHRDLAYNYSAPAYVTIVAGGIVPELPTFASNEGLCDLSDAIAWDATPTNAADAAAVTYSWTDADDNVVATTATYTPTAAGTYRVTVSMQDAEGVTISRNAMLVCSLTSSISIATQPAGTTVREGEEATLGVVATGEGLHYTWYVNTASASLVGATIVPGATTATITVSQDDAGSYYYCCTVTDNCGHSQTSDFAMLLVTAAPCFEAEFIATGSSSPAVGTTYSTNVANLINITDGTSIRLAGTNSSMTVDKNGLKFNSSKDTVYITLPAGSCLTAGSVISFQIQSSGTNPGFNVFSDASTEYVQLSTSVSGSMQTVTYVVQAGDALDQATILRLARSVGNSTYLKSFTVYGCGTPCFDVTGILNASATSICTNLGQSALLTFSYYQPGATISWYHNGTLIPGATAATYQATELGEYYAIATAGCARRSNIIKITDPSSSGITPLFDYWYVKEDRPLVYSAPLFLFHNVSHTDTTSNLASIDVKNLELEFVGDTLFLTGKPGTVLYNHDVTLTIQSTDICGNPVTASILLHLIGKTPWAEVAYVVEGKEKGDFYEGIVASQAQNHPLYQYLKNYFTVDSVNAYATVDESKIQQFYSRYDIMLLTDYPSTPKKDGGKSYCDALGCMIDKMPILSMEAYVSGLSNWAKVGLKGNPKDPNPAETTIDILCYAHDIFDNVSTIADDTIKLVSQIPTGDGVEHKGIQGFANSDAPDFINIATVDGGSNGTLIACCERQAVPEARLMFLCINHDALTYCTNDAKLSIRQILEYLMRKRPIDVADCALVFDDSFGDGLWSTAENWGPTYKHVPVPENAVRIEQPCVVDIPNAHASTMRMCKGTVKGHAVNGTLDIKTNGAVTIAGYIFGTQDEDFVTARPLDPSDIVIRSSATGTGSLIWGSATYPVCATVEYYSPAANRTIWQYMGTPLADQPTALSQYRGAWMCRWVNDPGELQAGDVGNWQWVLNEDPVIPFTGYCFTQIDVKTYTLQGTLCNPETRTFPLSYFQSDEGNGFNMLANSWVAPIRIADMAATDFKNADATIYIFNSGTRQQYEAQGITANPNATNVMAGQYNAVPVHASTYMDGALKEIPAMQGFFVQITPGSTANGSISLRYSDVVMNKTTFASTNTPMRAPRKAVADESAPEVLHILVGDTAGWQDEVYLLMSDSFTPAFDNGWDGRKMPGNDDVDMLAIHTPEGPMAVAALPQDTVYHLFYHAAADSAQRTFRFVQEMPGMSLVDVLTGTETEIMAGTEYSFLSSEADSARFVIRNTRGSATSLSNTHTASQGTICIYDPAGRLCYTATSRTEALSLSLPEGVWLMRDTQGNTEKILGGKR